MDSITQSMQSSNKYTICTGTHFTLWSHGSFHLFSLLPCRPVPYPWFDTLPCWLGLPEGHRLLWTLCISLQTWRLLLGLGLLYCHRWNSPHLHLCHLFCTSRNCNLQWQSSGRNRRGEKPYLPPLIWKRQKCHFLPCETVHLWFCCLSQVKN